MKKWYRISVPYGVFTVETYEGYVVETTPIAKWMKGKPLSYIKNWVNRKKGKVESI